jgi:hypothetical protein
MRVSMLDRDTPPTFVHVGYGMPTRPQVATDLSYALAGNDPFDTKSAG